MKKTLMFLGVVSMLAVTPAFAATAHKMPAKQTAAMCMVHGKKQACRRHIAHKAMKKHVTGYHALQPVKPAKPASAS